LQRRWDGSVGVRNKPHWDQASEADWDVARRREVAIAPLAALHRTDPRLIGDVAAALGLRRARVYALVAAFRARPHASTLLPARCGRREGARLLRPEVEHLIQAGIRDVYLKPERPTVTYLAGRIRGACRAAGLPEPSARAIRARVARIDAESLLHARHGAAAARRFRPAGSGRETGAPLDLVQIDHTLADVILVDATRREPIGRPWLTLMIDVATRMVAAAHVSLDPPSSLSVALALSQAVLPKAPHLARFGIEGGWPVQGLPRALHCDNAKEFRAAALERGAVEHGVRLEFRPPARPTYGAHIERLIGTVMGAVHLLPGTTFSNVAVRGDYDSVGTAAMILEEFEAWLLRQIVGIYHRTVHRSLGVPPLKAWEDAMSRRDPAPMPADPNRFYLDFLPAQRRLVRRDGIQLFGIHYWDNVLSPIAGRSSMPHLVKYDPRDLSRVHLRDGDGAHWAVPYRDLSRPPVTLWEHRAAVAQLRAEGRAAVDEDTLFRIIGEQRAAAAAAVAKTAKARRDAERNRRARKRPTGMRPPPRTVPSNAPLSEEPIHVEPFESEVW